MIFKRKLFWFVIVPIVVIAALTYGGDLLWMLYYGRSSQPIPSVILNVDKNFSHFPPNFPPDPGEAGKKTIQGIDADHDGIRDDVQRWIYAFVPNEPKKQMALRQMARYFQQYALADDYGPEVIRRSIEPLERANQCVMDIFRDGYLEQKYLKAKVLDTFSRVKRYWDNTRKITPMDVAGDLGEYESPCENR